MDDCKCTSCCSCGMPLDNKSKSKKDSCYCLHCQDQESGKLRSREEVREGSIKSAMRIMGKTRVEAAKMADEMMPKLPRWQKKEEKEDDSCCHCACD